MPELVTRMNRTASRTGLIIAVATALSSCSSSAERVEQPPLVIHSVSINYNNSHVVAAPQGVLMVDAGMYEDAPALEEKLIDAGIDLRQLRAIILTHGHADHAGGATYFQQKYSVPIVAGAADRKMLKSGQNDLLCPTGFFARRLLDEAQAASYPSTQIDVAIDQPTQLSDLLGVEGLPGQLHPVPGHTEGSIAVTMPGAAFVGDLFRGGIVFNQATEHFFMCDRQDNRHDIKGFLAGPAQQIETFFTGHFGPVDRASAIRLANSDP